MDGVRFLSDCLHDLPLNYPSAGDGVCARHHQPAPLFQFARERICRGCALLRQTYPSAKGAQRLGLGNYMLLTPSKALYWGNLSLPPPVQRHEAKGALRGVVRDLLLAPPEPPWLFIAFDRANPPDRLHVTTSNDLIFFSGKFLFPGTADEPPVERLNRARVIDIRAAATLSRREWEDCVRAQAALSTSAEALSQLQKIYARFPALAKQPIPPARTPEYNALRLLAEDSQGVI